MFRVPEPFLGCLATVALAVLVVAPLLQRYFRNLRERQIRIAWVLLAGVTWAVSIPSVLEFGASVAFSRMFLAGVSLTALLLGTVGKWKREQCE